MHAQIRTVPELPITDLLARAFGVRPVVYADARGRSAEIRLESGASLIIAGVKRARSPKREGLSQSDLRKAAKVRRDTNKMSTVEAARVRGWAVADNNEAEACFCGIAALAKGTGAP